MKPAVKKLMLRVIKSRMESGESFDDIIKDYPKLSDKEKEELKQELD